MNRSIRLPLLVFGASIVAATTFVPPAQAADCANPQGTGEARACAKAAEGATELRRFVERTQAIYNLYVQDFRVAGETVAAAPAADTTKVARNDR
jgi:hypothetical protein